MTSGACRGALARQVLTTQEEQLASQSLAIIPDAHILSSDPAGEDASPGWCGWLPCARGVPAEVQGVFGMGAQDSAAHFSSSGVALHRGRRIFEPTADGSGADLLDDPMPWWRENAEINE